MLQLHPEQEEDVQAILGEETHAGLIASEMGFGKTVVISEAIIRLNPERAFIIGVKDTYNQWRDTIAGQGGPELLRIDSTKQGRANLAALLAGETGLFFSGPQFLVTQDWVTADGASSMVGMFRKMKPIDVLVFDEVHMAGNRKSNTRKTLGTIKADWKIGASGTPTGNRFENFWSITRWLWPELIPARFYAWREQWCDTKKTYTPHGAVDSVIGERQPGAFAASLPLYIRRTLEDQPPAPKLLYVDLTPEQRKVYDALERDLLVWLQREGESEQYPLIVEIPANLRQRLRTATLGVPSFNADGELMFADDTESPKLAALRFLLDRWGGQPALIFTDSKRFAKVVVKRMKAAGLNVAEWSGDTSSVQRDRIREDFQNGKISYIVGVIQAMSTGLDGLQKVANKLVWLSELDGNQAVMGQAQRRLFRPGRTHENGGWEEVKVIARNTIEEDVFSDLILKAEARNAELRVSMNARQLGGVRAA